MRTGTVTCKLAFVPLVRNPHLLTVLGNFWPRTFDFSAFPVERRLIQTEQDVQVLVETQRPPGPPRAELVLVHGLEGSGQAGYIVSLAHQALTSGFTVHRFHMRTCGGTEHLCQTLYHAGLTGDLVSFLEQNQAAAPLFPIGFSLGGNVVLKAAAESGLRLLAGACTVSAPIDLALCARALEKPANRLYQNRFVARMKQRLLRTGRYRAQDLAPCRTIFEIDDRITAPSFGFASAADYYETQSALRFVPHIKIPVLMITAQDDTLIPFESYQGPAVMENPCIQVIAPEHGGHIGFLARTGPRFWADAVLLRWIEMRLASPAC